MKRKKRIAFSIVLGLFAILLLWIGFYFYNVSKSSVLFGKLVDKASDAFSSYIAPNNHVFVGDNFTLEASLDFDLESEYYPKQTDPELVKKANQIKNLNQLNSHFLVKQKAIDKTAYVEVDENLGEEELLAYKLFIDDATLYYFIKGIVPNYINQGTCNYFENINDEVSTKDNLDYLYSFVRESLKDNLKEEYFHRYDVSENIMGKKEDVYQISIKLDDKLIHTILNNVLKDLKEDKRASTILTNIDSSFMKRKIKDSTVFLDKNETYTISLFTTKFLYRPLKYEVLHVIEDNQWEYSYEGGDSTGTFYYVENNQVVYQVPCVFEDDKVVLQIEDYLGNKIGEFKYELEGNNRVVNYSFDDGNKKEDFVYSSKYTNYKKNKTYENKKSLSFKVIEKSEIRLSGNVVLEAKVENLAKIEEEITIATLASKLSDEEKDKIDHKWENMKARLER